MGLRQNTYNMLLVGEVYACRLWVVLVMAQGRGP